jgi:hypothetical protein
MIKVIKRRSWLGNFIPSDSDFLQHGSRQVVIRHLAIAFANAHEITASTRNGLDRAFGYVEANDHFTSGGARRYLRVNVGSLGNLVRPFAQSFLAKRDTGHLAIVANADEKRAAFGVGERRHAFKGFVVESLLELHGFRFALLKQQTQLVSFAAHKFSFIGPKSGNIFFQTGFEE